jgi:hypothetical protein
LEISFGSVQRKNGQKVWSGRTVAPPWKCTCSLCCGCVWIYGYKHNIIPHPSYSQDLVQCYFSPLPKLMTASTGRGFNITMMHPKSHDTQKKFRTIHYKKCFDQGVITGLAV